MIFTGLKVVWGIPKTKLPISNIPIGTQVKTRFRNHSFGKAYIRDGKGISENYILDKGDHWELMKIGENNNVK